MFAIGKPIAVIITNEMNVNIEPYLTTLFMSQYSSKQINDMWGMLKGVAKAKELAKPINIIDVSKSLEYDVFLNIKTAIDETIVAVTIFDDKLVWINAHKHKIEHNKMNGKLDNWVPIRFWIYSLNPILLDIAKPNNEEHAHINNEDHGTFSFKLLSKLKICSLSIFITLNINAHKIAGNAIPNLLKYLEKSAQKYSNNGGIIHNEIIKIKVNR